VIIDIVGFLRRVQASLQARVKYDSSHTRQASADSNDDAELIEGSHLDADEKKILLSRGDVREPRTVASRNVSEPESGRAHHRRDRKIRSTSRCGVR
jgi:hypothetical protein